MPKNVHASDVMRRLAITTVVVLGIWLLILKFNTSTMFWESFAVAALGALVAIAELVARYRDDPAGALISVPAILYVGVNAVAAYAALYLIHAFDWDFGADAETVALTQIMVAGLGSAALFRSSLFNVTAGDQVIGIGPSAVLNVILNAADRAVDRQRALIRSEKAAEIMADFSFGRSADALLASVVATMQNVSTDEAKVVEDKIARLRDKANDDLPDSVKAYVLGMCLLTVTGPKVLMAAVTHVNDAAADAAPVSASTDHLTELAAPAQQVLRTLSASKHPYTVAELQKALSLDYRAISEALTSLTAASAVRIDGTQVLLARP